MEATTLNESRMPWPAEATGSSIKMRQLASKSVISFGVQSIMALMDIKGLIRGSYAAKGPHSYTIISRY